MKKFLIFILWIIVLIMDIPFSQFFTILNANSLFIIVFLYFCSVFINPWLGLFLGALSGFIYDLYNPLTFGIHLLAFSSISAMIFLVKDKVFWEKYSSMYVLGSISFIVRLLINIPSFKGLLLSIKLLFSSVFLGTLYSIVTGLIVLFIINSINIKKEKNEI